MQTDLQTSVAARHIRYYLQSDATADEALRHMSTVQPEYRAQWLQATAMVTAGESMHGALSKVGLWKPAFLEAIKAGEQSGSTLDVLQEIEQLCQIIIDFKKELRTKLLAPIGYIAGGMAVFIMYVMHVIPAATKSVRAEYRNGMIAVMDGFHALISQYWWLLVLALLGVAVSVFLYGRSPQGAQQLGLMLHRVPLLGAGLTTLYAGIWAKFTALLDAAGDIPLDHTFLLAEKVLPASQQGYYRQLSQLADDERLLGMYVATPAPSADDPRYYWPVLLGIGLKSAITTGNLSEPLLNCAQSLIEEGRETLNRFTALLGLFALLFAVCMVVMPMATLIFVQFDVMNAIR